MTVLVAAGSKHGATQEIAAAIGRVLAERGIDVDVKSVENVGDPAAFEAFVVGSAVYMGNWIEPARRFVERYGDVLAARPTWLFSGGPVGDPPTPSEDKAVQIDAIVARTGAREHRLFPGKLEKSQLSFRERALVRAVRAPEGDFRDWDAIRAWAEQIAAELGATEAVAT